MLPPVDDARLPRARRGLQRSVYLLPNLCTMGNLFFGFFAIVQGIAGRYELAAWCILAAGLCDQLDGRMARLAKAESAFGVEFDALADLISFGLAPSLLLYYWSLHGFRRAGLIAAFLFVGCGALRLARFNVQSHSVEKRYFQGLPIPMAAATVVSGLLAYLSYVGKTAPGADWRILVGTALLAILMISTVRYRSFKQINLRSRHSFLFLALLAGVVGLIAAEPDIAPFALCVTYVVSGIVETSVQWLWGAGATVQQARRRSHARRAARKALVSNVHSLWPQREPPHD